MSLTPEDVERATFRSTRLRQGYDEDEVDDLLERVVDAMRAGEPFADLLDTPLALTRMRAGYDPADVDVLFARLRRAAARVPSGAGPRQADAWPEPVQPAVEDPDPPVRRWDAQAAPDQSWPADDDADVAFPPPETWVAEEWLQREPDADEAVFGEYGADGPGVDEYARPAPGVVPFGQTERRPFPTGPAPEPIVDEPEPDAVQTVWKVKPHHFPVPLVASPPPADEAAPAGADGEELAERVLNAAFRATRLRSGYEQSEVDRFLDQIVMDLRAGLDVAEQVRTVRFTVVQWQDGYEQDDVDEFLDGFLR